MADFTGDFPHREVSCFFICYTKLFRGRVITLPPQLADKGVSTVILMKSFGRALARVLFSKACAVEVA